MRQFSIAKQSVGKCSRVPFVDEANWPTCYMIKPRSEIAGFLGFLAFASVAMDRHAYDPSENLVLVSQIFEVLLIERNIPASVSF